jgi:hypothetical protein
MKPYDDTKTYLGPNGHWSKKWIPKVPPGVEIVHPYWNKAAYNHDVAYDGNDYSGLLGWVKKWLNRREVERQRLKADKAFLNDLLLGIERAQHKMTGEQLIIAQGYAQIVFDAVHAFGWSFYKTGSE